VRPNVTVPLVALRPLVEALADPKVAIAQPLIERSDMTVASAGAVFAPASLHPSPFLEGFPVSDAARLGAIDLPTVASQGYCFQVDLTWRAAQAGYRIAEVPITFVERDRGESKMDNAIVREALLRITQWGLQRRVGQLRRLVRL